MPDWLWVLFIFLALTFGYFIGFATGSYKHDADKPPTENAYIREAEIMAEANKEIEIRRAELEQQTEIEKYKISAEQVKEELKQHDSKAQV